MRLSARVALVVMVAAIVVGGAALSPELAMARCRPCGFAGSCGEDETCGPTAAGCRPRHGVLLFRTVSPPYVYWLLHAKRKLGNRHGRMGGKLTVHLDAGVPTTGLPGFPPRRCDAETCFGQNARFLSAVEGDLLSAKAHYPTGEVCVIYVTLAHGEGPATSSNHIECRDAAGTRLLDGPLHVQGMRLSGCRE